MNAANTEQLIIEARKALRLGRPADAAKLYRAVLDRVAHPEAIEFLGTFALRTGRPDLSVELFSHLCDLDASDLHARESYGIALALCARHEEAANALRDLLSRHHELYVARLFLGCALRAMGRREEAQAHYAWAIAQAQKRGQWRDRETTPQWLFPAVADAVRFVGEVQYEQLTAGLESVGREHDGGSLARVEAFVRSHVGLDRKISLDPRQAPRQQYFPGLPASPWIDTEILPWTRLLEAHTDVVRQEFLTILNSAAGVEPFLHFNPGADVSEYLGGRTATPSWDAFFFYRHGVRKSENCARCPGTAALLEKLPLIRLLGMAPEICFSILAPGTHIKAHHGDSNIRVVVHLPLVVPGGCGLKVAGEERQWEVGRAIAFDDTYEHEAWNSSDSLRAVLLMDAWNPHLTAIERSGVMAVATAMQKLGETNERYRQPA